MSYLLGIDRTKQLIQYAIDRSFLSANITAQSNFKIMTNFAIILTSRTNIRNRVFGKYSA